MCFSSNSIQDWTKKGGWRVISSRETVTPGHPRWNISQERTKMSDYNDRGFKNAPI